LAGVEARPKGIRNRGRPARRPYFAMKEKDLSVALGLTRDVLKKMRSEYTEGEDWVRVPSNKPKNLWEVQWTEQGLEKLRDVVGVVPEEEIVPPAMHKGTVLARFPNQRFIQVDFNGAKHVVLCRDNTKFVKGMPVWARWDGSRWVVVRHPRFAGKY